MTQEEKAKAYDEAIKRLEDIETGNCQKTFMFTEGLFDYIFPELKESEDERIRKSLSAYFAKFKPNDMWDADFSFGDIVAWLEKQCHTFTKKDVDDAYLKGVCDTKQELEKQGEQESAENKGMNLVEEEMTPFQKKVFCIIDTTIEEEQGLKQVCDELFALASNEIGQKPAAWSEDDEENLNWFEKFFRAESVIAGGKDIPQDRYLWFKSLKDRVQPQQKQEWSKEDNAMLIEIEDILNGRGHSFYDKEIAWLKSLRHQPKQEWSQKDIDMIDWLIRCCEKEHEELCNDKYGHQDIVSDLKRDCRKKWDWLESLKNRVAPQNQWKPSERQKEALLWCVVHLGGADKQTLGELLEELNKL